MYHGRKPADDDIGDALLVQDLTDLNGIEHQRVRRSEACARSWIASIVFAASTMDRTRSGTVIRNCRRI